MTVGEKIYALRKSNGLSQEEFAFRAGVSKQTVFKWENGIVTPKFDNIEKIIREFGLRSSYFFSDACKDGNKDCDVAESTSVEEKQSRHRRIRDVILGVSTALLFLITCAFAVLLGFSIRSGKDALTSVVIIDFDIAVWVIFMALLLVSVIMSAISVYFFITGKKSQDKDNSDDNIR